METANALSKGGKKVGITSCKFWGLGSDGIVGSNKSAIKIIGECDGARPGRNNYTESANQKSLEQQIL